MNDDLPKALFDQYRPKDWSEVVGQDAALQRVQTLAKRGLGHRAYWISGLTGTGKDTIGRLLIEDAGIDTMSTERANGADLSMDWIRDVERKCSTGGTLWSRMWGIVIDEAHKMRSAIVSRLLTTLDPENPENALRHSL